MAEMVSVDYSEEETMRWFSRVRIPVLLVGQLS